MASSQPDHRHERSDALIEIGQVMPMCRCRDARIVFSPAPSAGEHDQGDGGDCAQQLFMVVAPQASSRSAAARTGTVRAASGFAGTPPFWLYWKSGISRRVGDVLSAFLQPAMRWPRLLAPQRPIQSSTPSSHAECGDMLNIAKPVRSDDRRSRCPSCRTPRRQLVLGAQS